MEKKVKKQATSPLNRMSAWMSGFVQTADKVLSAEKGESKTGKDALVDFLKTTPEALDAFEKAYRKEVIDDNDYSYDGVPNAKQAAAVMNRETPEALDELVCRIVEELIALTPVWNIRDVVLMRHIRLWQKLWEALIYSVTPKPHLHWICQSAD